MPIDCVRADFGTPASPPATSPRVLAAFRHTVRCASGGSFLLFWNSFVGRRSRSECAGTAGDAGRRCDLLRLEKRIRRPFVHGYAIGVNTETDAEERGHL